MGRGEDLARAMKKGTTVGKYINSCYRSRNQRITNTPEEHAKKGNMGTDLERA